MTFQDRLKACMERGNLTVADLARWFDRPDPTLRGWVNNGIKPTCPSCDMADIMSSLTDLETRIRRKEGFPVPRMSQRSRKIHVERLRK